ncbi:MAG: DNA-binding domain-containing protein [Rhodovibrionaceae bacterium]
MLAELQNAFRRAVLQGEDTEALRAIEARGIAPAERLAVYRNNSFGSLTGVLAAAYPALQRLLSADNFRILARAYIAAHPPRLPQLLSYGGEMAEFLGVFTHTKGDVFFAELARLEWARNETLFAADAPILTAQSLQGLPPESFGGLRLPLHPATRLIESDYAIFRLWQAEKLGPGVALGAETVLVTRSAEGAILQRLAPPGDAALLLALAAGMTLDEAAEAAFAEEAGFDLQAALADHLARATFTRPELPA